MVSAAGVATMIFYNQVLGVSAALCGTAFLIASLVDAISDPLAGALSDSVRTRWGRRHPFMLAAALPLGVCFYLLYQPPGGLSEIGLFWWFTVTLVGLRLAKTVFAVPHGALGAELTDDYHERTKIFGWDWVVRMLGSVVLSVIILFIIFPTTPDYANGLLNVDRYRYLAIGGGIFCSAVMIGCTFATADQIPFLHKQLDVVSAVKRSYQHALREIWQNMKALIVNPSYISVCACWLILAISGGVVAVVSTYAFLYAFEFTTEQIAIREFVRIPGVLAGITIATYLTRLIDKKYTVILTIAVGTLMIGLPYCLRLLDWLPANGTTLLLITVFGIWTLGFFAHPVVAIVIDSQLVDITDDHELKTGNRAEGLIFSIRTFALKLTLGLGGLIAGFGLEFINFPQHATQENMTPEILDGLLIMIGPLYYLIVFAGLSLAFLYRIDRTQHADILKQLEARRGS